ncbi:MAG: DUF4115 domain-containing protein, partial [Acetobacteraceae bacterium]
AAAQALLAHQYEPPPAQAASCDPGPLNRRLVLARLLHPGDTLVPPAPGLTLTTGNAGGTELVVNGHAGPPLGATGVVLHGVKLTPPG